MNKKIILKNVLIFFIVFLDRRTRAATAKAGSKSTTATIGRSTVIDATDKMTVSALNDFASPKRKDCKLDMNLNQNILVNGNGGKRTTNKGNKMKKQQQSPITIFFHNDRNIITSASELDNHNASVNESDSSIQNKQLHDTNSLPNYASKQNGILLNEESNIYNVNDITDEEEIDIVRPDCVSLKHGLTNGFQSLLTSPPSKLNNSSMLKQTTPHRIVAPSSPTKKHRKYAVPGFSDLNIDDNAATEKHSRKAAAKRNQKSKRRLLKNGTENLIAKVNEDVKEIITISDDSSDAVPTSETSNEHEEDSNKNLTTTKLNNKMVLNSCVDPTAEQNTTNNNKSSTGPISTTDQQTKVVQRTHDTQMTDYFPIRRSVRKTKKAVEEEQLRYIEIAIEKQQEDGLIVKDFGEKGRGIVAGRPFSRGEFVVEYIGELIDQSEADRREEEYAKNVDFGCYMYYFKHKEQQWW